jgi:adenylylsulfate reductase subunit B
MSININSKSCVGCGKCIEVCPGGLIYRDESGKAYMKFPQDCWGCTACLKECGVGAIKYYLGADIGGRGAYMYTKKEKRLLKWHIVKPNKEEVVITTNGEEANKY